MELERNERLMRGEGGPKPAFVPRWTFQEGPRAELASRFAVRAAWGEEVCSDSPPVERSVPSGQRRTTYETAGALLRHTDLGETPRGEARFRRTSTAPGEPAARHWRTPHEASRTAPDRFGRPTAKGERAEDVLRADAARQQTSIANLKASLGARRGLDSREEGPLGRAFVRCSSLPAGVSNDSHCFGARRGQGHGQGSTWPPRGWPSCDGRGSAHYRSGGALEQEGKDVIAPSSSNGEEGQWHDLYVRSHQDYRPGEQVKRDYRWPQDIQENFQNFRFGIPARGQRLHQGEAPSDGVREALFGGPFGEEGAEEGGGHLYANPRARRAPSGPLPDRPGGLTGPRRHPECPAERGPQPPVQETVGALLRTASEPTLRQGGTSRGEDDVGKPTRRGRPFLEVPDQDSRPLGKPSNRPPTPEELEVQRCWQRVRETTPAPLLKQVPAGLTAYAVEDLGLSPPATTCPGPLRKPSRSNVPLPSKPWQESSQAVLYPSRVGPVERDEFAKPRSFDEVQSLMAASGYSVPPKLFESLWSVAAQRFVGNRWSSVERKDLRVPLHMVVDAYAEHLCPAPVLMPRGTPLVCA